MKSRIITSTIIIICLMIILFVVSSLKGYGDQQLPVIAASQGSVTDILSGLGKTDQIGVSQSIQSPIPRTPPDARKISVSDPDIAGYAMVTGNVGAVPAGADVVIVNISAFNVITTTADLDGSFAVDGFFAPPGSSLLVKYETGGERIKNFWLKALQGVADGTTENLNELPGTVLYVGGPEQSGEFFQAFHTVGAVSSIAPPKEWAGWWIEGELTVPNPSEDWRMSVMPGDEVILDMQMNATSPALNCTGPLIKTLWVKPELREMFGMDGVAKAWEIWFDASLFTPTGLPIEHEGHVPSVSLEGEAIEFQNFSCLDEHVLTAELQTAFVIPDDLREGYYRPDFFFNPQITLSDQVPQAVVWLYSAERPQGLPILRVGEPAPPRIPWLMFGDELVNGQRGVPAFEDRGRFEMVNRVTTTSHLSVIPRIDDRTGQAIVYDLAPGASWLSNTDRRLAPPPHIPFYYPSGEMSVDIQRPDGSSVTLGPAPLQGSSVRTPTTPGGAEFAIGTGHLGDIYHLYNFENAFKYAFHQEGWHVIRLHGTVYDVFGNPYSLESTYEVMVAHVLDVDPNILPTTPFTQADFFSAGLHLFPPVPAHVNIRLTHIPDSDLTQTEIYTVTGQANLAGYFHTPPGFSLPMDSAGEYRVDISAEHHTPSGEIWFGAMTWGSVVESSGFSIRAHGRRGMDYHDDTIDNMPTWFHNADLDDINKVGIENYYPYFSGDIHWGVQDPEPVVAGDSIHTILTFEDLTFDERYYELIRTQYPKATNAFRWPPDDISLVGLNKRIAINEAPLFITTQNGKHPELYPEEIDFLGYWYGSSQRPDVRVRELISEDNMGTAYWRFDDTYGYQIGEPADGDHPGDIKWEFGGLVLRTITETNPINQYAIYNSLWVLLPDACDTYGCARVTPPFQDATGASVNGGPIMTLLGQDVDMLFLPKCVRPGDILELGNTISFCGHVGPPLDSRVTLAITSPSGVSYVGDWHANKIGWLYDPSFDFPAEETGRWTVDIFVEHDRPYIGNNVIPANHNTGTVLGTQGQYDFYVVESESSGLLISSPQPGFITWPFAEIEPILITGRVPAGTNTVFYTVHDKGIVMDQGILTPGSDLSFTYLYDPKTLHADFPMLSLTAHEGRWEGLADEVAIHFLAVGSGIPRAASVTLIGEQVFISNLAHSILLPLVVR